MNENATTDTSIMETTFVLPDMVDSAEFSNDELAEDMNGLQMTFQRVKIPSGGALQFELPSDDPEDPDYAKTLQGIIIHHHLANAYWPDGNSEDESTPPICSSSDGCTGVGSPGGSCNRCGFNQYGSDPNGRGKACKNMHSLYLLRSGDYLPILLPLPPTSLRPFSEFANTAFIARRRASYGSLVEIGLRRMDNGNLYSVATFKKLQDFSGPELAQIKQYATGFKEQVKSHLQDRAAENEASAYEFEQYVENGGYEAPGLAGDPEDLSFDPPAEVQEDEDLPFDVPAGEGPINGDLDKLPA